MTMNTMKTYLGTKRHVMVLLGIVTLAFSSLAQPSRVSLSSEYSQLRVERISPRMDSIREHRPTVALVLSGGGAKGAAHVGVIRYLESIGMPIDIVVGTSMGGLIGGMYALGFRGDQLDSLIRQMDWNMVLSDKVPREYISYSEAKYNEKYLLSFPFFYGKDEYEKLREDGMLYRRNERGNSEIHLGAGNRDASSLIKDNLLGGLSSAMVFGQNVGNLLGSLTVGYQDEMDFYRLPIPFVCVATDLVTGTAKVWTEGKLTTALRSTMSIPGMFAPVKTGGMVLVDGGMRNNYPTDLAKMAGADYVIGVDLSGDSRDYSEINNLGDIIGTGVEMLGRASYERNVLIPDVTIKPVLKEFNMLSFSERNIDTIVNRGYRASLDMAAELDSLKSILGPDTTVRYNRSAVDLGEEKVMISGVEITGVDDRESLYLMNKIALDAGSKMGRAEIENAAATIYGTNAFDYVTYELSGDREPFRLKFDCVKGPIHQVGVGGRFDTEEIVSVLVNVGLNVHKLQGSSVDFTAKVGTNPYANLNYSFVTRRGTSLNAMAGIRYTDRNAFSIGDNRFKINFINIRQEFYLSNIKWSKYFLRTGIRNDWYSVNSMMAEQVIGDYDLEQLKNDYITYFFNAGRDDFDNGYIPTKGSSLGVSYEWVFGGFPHKFNNFHTVLFNWKSIAGGDAFAFIPSLSFRFLFGEDVPIPFTNTMGGSMAGRYLDQQLPFIGINNAAAMQNMLGIARTDFRVKLFKNNYLTAIANYAVSCNEFNQLKSAYANTDHFGVGLQYTYNLILGPVSANLHWSTYTRRVGAYFSIGFDF